MATINHKNDVDSDLLKSVEEHINEDINCLINTGDINMAGRKTPTFDEYGVYSKLLNSIEQYKKKRRRAIVGWACAAAIAAIVVMNAFYLFDQQLTSDNVPLREIYAAKGEKLVVVLTDGSRVWLNADSKLVYPETFVGDERNVEIVGEAYFEVKKNPDRPFMVKVDNMKVKVTGTSFNVTAYPTDKMITTTLEEGKIMIGGASNKGGAANKQCTYQEMMPGQKAVYNKLNAECVIQNDENYKDLSSWKENRLTFRNTSLQDVLSVLSRTFDVQFTIHNKRVAKFTYNFVCGANDLSDILDIMTSITPLTYKKTDINQYEIN